MRLIESFQHLLDRRHTPPAAPMGDWGKREGRMGLMLFGFGVVALGLAVLLLITSQL